MTFRSTATGAGQCVGIIALGGGYLEIRSRWLRRRRWAGRRRRWSSARSAVPGNQPVIGTDADEEIALDMQVVAALVPAARIVVYFAPNGLAGLADALHEAVHDDVNRPQVLSICWGSAEKFWHDDVRETAQAALEDAVQLKVSVTVAAGDYLATGGLSDGKAHVFFPASSPYVLACGGTTARLSPTGASTAKRCGMNGTIGTGGGISDVFGVPDYQKRVALPASVNDGKQRRGIPDVAGAAAQQPGYRIILDGAPLVKNGTSAVAPLWAALITMLNAARGSPIGLINPLLYGNAGLCRGIATGDNRVGTIGYDAGPGWNACTGLGVPKGADIAEQLAAGPMV